MLIFTRLKRPTVLYPSISCNNVHIPLYLYDAHVSRTNSCKASYYSGTKSQNNLQKKDIVINLEMYFSERNVTIFFVEQNIKKGAKNPLPPSKKKKVSH